MENVHKELEDEIKMIENILKPILGRSFVHCPLIVLLKAEEIRMLNEAMSKFRPAHRRHKSVKEEDAYVLMLPDYCSIPQSLNLLSSQGPVLCIEIKPKQGFVKEECLPTSLNTLPVPMCRFCMMQKYKLKKGAISSQSGYCPTDLFSGNTDLLCNLTMQALLKPFPDGMQHCPVSSKRTYSKKCKNAYSDSSNDAPNELPPFCILDRILNCQLLDDLPISDLFKLYIKVKESVNKSSDYIGCHLRSEFPPHVGELQRNSNESEYQYVSRKVWEFLLALTLKDCSIMLVLRHLVSSSFMLPTQNVISDKDENLYLFSIALADLDSKALHKVEKVHNYMSFLTQQD